MQAYITKYALSVGIYCQEVEPEGTNGWAVARAGADYLEYFCISDYHTSFAEASKRANNMRSLRIESLKSDLARKAESVGRQIRNLEGMQFNLQDCGSEK